ncbi:hypothetical protein [Sphingopyxis sp. NFH-91]|uniref:hypothetical protein n=1 Tax=Sphingopyxis sp. NFH-91 TaxID=2744457 RepID=UPI001F2E5CAD|nr:hypothetical protein [Sphingopyxis sp. NFH-91]
MRALDLPAPRDGDWYGVLIDEHDIAGTTMTAVTIRGRRGQRAERRWFDDGGIALAWASTQADARHLPLFDLRDPAE